MDTNVINEGFHSRSAVSGTNFGRIDCAKVRSMKVCNEIVYIKVLSVSSKQVASFLSLSFWLLCTYGANGTIFVINVLSLYIESVAM